MNCPFDKKQCCRNYLHCEKCERSAPPFRLPKEEEKENLKKMKRKIYIAASWKHAEFVRAMANSLRCEGHQVFDFTDPENRVAGLDKFVFGAKQWAEFSGKNPSEIEYTDFLTWEPTQRAFKSDKAGLDWADMILLILPCGRSAHLEAGYGVGSGKDLIIYGTLPIGEFEAMYGFAKACFRIGEEPELFQFIKSERDGEL